MSERGKLVKKYIELKEDHELLTKAYSDLQEALCKINKEIANAPNGTKEEKASLRKCIRKKNKTELSLIETKKNLDRMAEILQEIEKELDIS